MEARCVLKNNSEISFSWRFSEIWVLMWLLMGIGFQQKLPGRLLASSDTWNEALNKSSSSTITEQTASQVKIRTKVYTQLINLNEKVSDLFSYIHAFKDFKQKMATRRKNNPLITVCQNVEICGKGLKIVCQMLTNCFTKSAESQKCWHRMVPKQVEKHGLTYIYKKIRHELNLT